MRSISIKQHFTALLYIVDDSDEKQIATPQTTYDDKIKKQI
jgi:hypothetical protein